MSFLQKFMLICSGANLSILKKTPAEWNKFSGIGGVALFTAFLASLSAGYVVHTIFENLATTIFLGLIQGLIIFNLNRYIVSSIKKTEAFGNNFSWLFHVLLSLFF